MYTEQRNIPIRPVKVKEEIQREGEDPTRSKPVPPNVPIYCEVLSMIEDEMFHMHNVLNSLATSLFAVESMPSKERANPPVEMSSRLADILISIQCFSQDIKRIKNTVQEKLGDNCRL